MEESTTPPRIRRQSLPAFLPPALGRANSGSSEDEFAAHAREFEERSSRPVVHKRRSTWNAIVNVLANEVQDYMGRGGGSYVADDDDFDTWSYTSDTRGSSTRGTPPLGASRRPPLADISLFSSPSDEEIDGGRNGRVGSRARANSSGTSMLDEDAKTPLLGARGSGMFDSDSGENGAAGNGTTGNVPRWSPIVRRTGSGLTRTAITFTKAMVGTYVLYLPHAFAVGGGLFSGVSLVVIAAASVFCMLLLLDSRSAAAASFGDVGAAAFGSTGRACVEISLVSSQLGFCTVYYMFVAKNLGAVIGLNTLEAIAAQVAVYVPLACVRHLHYLGAGMLIANAGIAVGLAITLYTIASRLVTEGVADGVVLINPSKAFMVLGSMVSSFEGIGLVVPLQDAMSSGARASFPSLLRYCSLGIVSFFLLLGLAGYLAYGPNVESFVTMQLPARSVQGVTARAFYSIGVMLTYPLQLFPAVKVLDRLIWPPLGPIYDRGTLSSPQGTLFKPTANSSTNNSGNSTRKSIRRRRWEKNGLRISIVLFTALVALVAGDSFDAFAGLLGALCAVPLALIYPPLFHLKICGSTVSTRMRFIEWTVVVTGVCAAAASASVSFYSLVW